MAFNMQQAQQYMLQNKPQAGESLDQYIARTGSQNVFTPSGSEEEMEFDLFQKIIANEARFGGGLGTAIISPNVSPVDHGAFRKKFILGALALGAGGYGLNAAMGAGAAGTGAAAGTTGAAGAGGAAAGGSALAPGVLEAAGLGAFPAAAGTVSPGVLSAAGLAPTVAPAFSSGLNGLLAASAAASGAGALGGAAGAAGPGAAGTGGAGGATGAATGAAGATGGAGAAGTAGGAGTAASGTAATGSALSRLLGLGQTGQDALSVFGDLAPALLGAYQANQQSDALGGLADRFFAMGQPSLDRFNSSFAPGFDLASGDPGFQNALDTGASSAARALSTKFGNPADSPAAQAELQKYVAGNLYLPQLNTFRSQNLTGAGLGTNTAGTAATNQIAAQGGVLGSVGFGLGNVTRPQTSLDDLLKQLNLRVA